MSSRLDVLERPFTFASYTRHAHAVAATSRAVARPVALAAPSVALAAWAVARAVATRTGAILAMIAPRAVATWAVARAFAQGTRARTVAKRAVTRTATGRALPVSVARRAIKLARSHPRGRTAPGDGITEQSTRCRRKKRHCHRSKPHKNARFL